MALAVGTMTMSDAELIVASRQGNGEAYAELYRRHKDAASAGARALTKSRSDADDVVSESFARVLRALQAGSGPDLAFRPYLLTTVRNTFYDRVRRDRELPTEHESLERQGDATVGELDAAEGSLAAAAYSSLPERWQQVLWYTEVEGKNPKEIAPLLGLAPNAVAALTYRAREGLRQAYLQAHLREPRASDCRDCSSNLGAYVRDGLAARDRRKVDEHVEHCATCKGLLAELVDTNTTLRAALVPAVLGVSAAAYLAGLGGIAGKGAAGWIITKARNSPGGASAAAAAAVVTMVAVGVVAARSGESTTAAASTTTTAATVSVVSPSPTQPSTVTGAPTSVDTSVPRATTPATVATTLPASTVATTAFNPPIFTPPPKTVPRTPRPFPRPPTTTRPPTTPRPVTTPRPTTTPRPSTTLQPSTTLAATTTRPAPTTARPTTTVRPPTIVVSIAQSGPAVPGGQLPLAVALSQTANQRTSPTVITLGLPPGLSVAGVSDPAWVCTSAGVCTVGGTGDTSATVILDVAPTASGALGLAPSANFPVASIPSSVTITPVSIDGVLHQSAGRGSVVSGGNSVVTCLDTSPSCVAARSGGGARLDNDDHPMTYVDTAALGTFNSSSADINFSGTVRAAYLVWGGDTLASGVSAVDPSMRGTVQFQSAGVVTTVTADRVVDGTGGSYVAAADVTDFVAGPGSFAVGGLQASIGQSGFGGWSLIVVTDDASQPLRVRLVSLPVFAVGTSSFTWNLPLPSAVSGRAVGFHVTAFNTDLGDEGESFTVNGTPLPVLFDSSSPGPRAPADSNTFGIDVAVGGTTVDSAEIDVRISSAGDRFTIGAFSLVLDVPALVP
jgi:RNA polymerase sigma factor (sigma-70 family)